MENHVINQIDRILANSGCGRWELSHLTTLYLPDNQRKERGYDCITYYRGGYDYPTLCFVKERIISSNYGAYKERTGHATPQEFLALLEKQTYYGGIWRTQEEMDRIKNMYN